MTFLNYINQLKHQLTLPLPGEEAQYALAPQGRRNFPENKVKTTAAVMILLFPIHDEPWLVFIKRPEYNGAHSGQVSFPGGKVESEDISLYHTAMRETSEELGIKKESIQYVGKLSPLLIPVSGFHVYPFVGSCSTNPNWNPDKEEVKYTIESPVSALQNNETIKTEIWNLHGHELEVPFYFVKEEKIWGATAMILAEFLTVWKNIHI